MRWLTDDEQRLWRLILDADSIVRRAMEDTLQVHHSLTTAEFAVLVALSEAEDQMLRLRELCASLRWDRSRTSHQVTRMEKRGLVDKRRCEGDGRGVLVQLTDEGRQRLETAAPDHVESVRAVVFDQLGSMTDQELAIITKFLTAITSSPRARELTDTVS